MRFVRSPAAARNISGERDHLPAAGMVLAAPEFVVAELVQVLDEIEIAAELQHRMLADRMVRGEEGAEAETWHEVDAPVSRRNIDSAFPPAAELVGAIRWR